MASEQDKSQQIFFENLDGLRFLCFLAVFFFHSFHTEFQEIKSDEYYTLIKKGIFGNGNLGVNFFFVLSGFLITYLLIEEKKYRHKINIPFFWMRRILRIWPLYFLCVFFGFFIFPLIKSFFGQTPNETAHIFYYLTFLNNFDFIKNGLPDSSNLGVLWSIAIEEQFYFIWPIILSFIPVKKMWIVFIIIILGSITFRFFYQSPITYEHHTLSCIGDMTVGSFGSWLVLQKPKFLGKIINLKKIQIFFIYFAFISIFFYKEKLFYWNDGLKITERIIIAFIILLIILEQNYSTNSFFKMSKFRRISYLGTISYGLYCLHFIGILITTNTTKILNINNHFWQVIILETSIALFLTILISKLSFKFIEKPFLSLKNKFSFIKK